MWTGRRACCSTTCALQRSWPEGGCWRPSAGGGGPQRTCWLSGTRSHARPCQPPAAVTSQMRLTYCTAPVPPPAQLPQLIHGPRAGAHHQAAQGGPGEGEGRLRAQTSWLLVSEGTGRRQLSPAGAAQHTRLYIPLYFLSVCVAAPALLRPSIMLRETV